MKKNKIKISINQIKVISLVVGILILILILSGQSFAIFSGTMFDENSQIVKAGNFEVALETTSNSINTNLDILSDVEGLLQTTTYNFTVENVGDSDAIYKILIVDDEELLSTYTGDLINKTKIRVGLELNDTELGPLTLGELNNVLNEEKINKGDKNIYKLRLWLDSSVELEEIKTQKIFLKLKLEAEQYFGNNLDTSGANEPALLNMIPVYYDGSCNENAGCWKKADSQNKNETYKWYNYDEKMWANAVTVDETNRQNYISAPEGTEIPMDEINAMWVWIPRYTYTYLNTNTPEEIQIEFEEGIASNGTITCTDNVSGSGTTSQTCTDKKTTSLVAGTSTYTHPAFDFGGTPLTGFWMGKFENSATSIPTSASTAEHTLIIKPNMTSLRYKAVSYQFRDVRQMEKYNNIYGFEQANTTTFTFTGELTGDTNDLDTHMLKNIEWGAVAYLSHSKYGINKKIAINSYSTYMTGCGPQSADSTSSGTTCNAYNTDLGQTSSTTGNVYGVYDMSGGTLDRVMGNHVNSSGNFYPSSAGQWSSTIQPLAKYYDSYTYNTSTTMYTRGRLGDATVEMKPTGTTGNWYSEYAYFLSATNSWFYRGGHQNFGANAGAFFFNGHDGSASNVNSSRSALVVLD